MGTNQPTVHHNHDPREPATLGVDNDHVKYSRLTTCSDQQQEPHTTGAARAKSITQIIKSIVGTVIIPVSSARTRPHLEAANSAFR